MDSIHIDNIRVGIFEPFDQDIGVVRAICFIDQVEVREAAGPVRQVGEGQRLPGLKLDVLNLALHQIEHLDLAVARGGSYCGDEESCRYLRAAMG